MPKLRFIYVRRLVLLENTKNSIIGIAMMAVFIAGAITAHHLTNAPEPTPAYQPSEERTDETLKLFRKAYLDAGLTPPTTQDANNIGRGICNNIESGQPAELHHTQYQGNAAAIAAAANYAYATLDICPGWSISFSDGNQLRTKFETSLAETRW